MSFMSEEKFRKHTKIIHKETHEKIEIQDLHGHEEKIDDNLSYKLQNDFHCNMCNLTLPSKQTFDEHNATVHEALFSIINVKLHQCSICEFKSKKKNDVKRHETEVHEDLLRALDARNSRILCMVFTTVRLCLVLKN